MYYILTTYVRFWKLNPPSCQLLCIYFMRDNACLGLGTKTTRSRTDLVLTNLFLLPQTHGSDVSLKTFEFVFKLPFSSTWCVEPLLPRLPLSLQEPRGWRGLCAPLYITSWLTPIIDPQFELLFTPPMCLNFNFFPLTFRLIPLSSSFPTHGFTCPYLTK